MTFKNNIYPKSIKYGTAIAVACIFGFSSAQAIEAGIPAPDCQLQHIPDDGKSIPLATPGKVLYVDYWASWCGPCVQSMPFLNEVYQRYQTQGLEIVAINVDENLEDADAFLKQHPVKVPIAHSADGQCPLKFDVQTMPTSYLIDKHGQIRHVQLGFRTSETAEVLSKIKALLEEK